MSIIPLLEEIQKNSLSLAIREGGLPYPIIGGIHLLAIAIFGGMVLMTDMRLMGWGMMRWKVSEIVQQLRLWKWAGFVVITVTGLLLAWAEPIRLYKSPSFWIKMVLLALLGVHALVFRRDVYLNPALDKGLTPTARRAAIFSMLLWVGLIVSGRWIAFDD
jgi:Family of unknown function (DUF6644)